ncbi:RICIN domain-containing protein [Sorangium sp. So ce1182]|uniref:RICIN domain-containing protein n=1 Tax=Sorangium sp. So ce1182 TaxID=3133334 RepID=UPI003F5F651D
MRTSHWSHLSLMLALAGPAGCALDADAEGEVEMEEGDVLAEDLSTSTTYTLVGVQSGRCVDVPGRSTADDVALDLWDCNGQTNQQFRFEVIDGGYYRIRNVNSNKCLDVRSASTADGAALVQYTCHTSANQQWTVTDLGSDTVRITSRLSGKSLDAYGAATANGTAIVQWGYSGGANQKWKLVAVGSGGGATGGSERRRIMPLGDSITATGCFRAVLWQKLRDSGRTNFDLVGSQNSDSGCSPSGYDRGNEGHSGYLVTDMAGSKLSELRSWLSANPADIVLMHLGTNDVWSNRSVSSILGAYSTVVDELRMNNPRVVVLVAKIVPMKPSNCSDCGARVQALNSAIPGWASGKATSASPVVVVDQWTGFNTDADTYDGVHPNSGTGSQKLATRWYDALVPYF